MNGRVVGAAVKAAAWLLGGTSPPPPRDGGPGDGVEIYPEVVDMTAALVVLVCIAYGLEFHAALGLLGLVLRWVLRRPTSPDRSRGNAAS
jgi:hypothetical protein